LPAYNENDFQYHLGALEMHFRNFVTLFLSITLLLAACSSPASSAASELQVVASTQILGDVVRQVGGATVNVTVIIPPDTDPHAYEPVPQDASRLAEADLIFVNGLGLEEALQPLLDANTDRLVLISDGIVTLESTESHEEEGADHEDEHDSDPHVWMNPQYVKIWVDNIAAALAGAYPANATNYAANAEAYKSQLDELDVWALAQIAQIPEAQRVLVTDHESLAYFAEHYGFDVVGAIVPSSSMLGETSAGELAALEDTIREAGVKAIFVGASANPQLAEQVATDTGAQVVVIYSESLTAAGGDAPSYLDLIRFDIDAIVSALR
jgi:ABC-type Zn uptake system ZnuABC Zn-binding protein ZnuA